MRRGASARTSVEAAVRMERILLPDVCTADRFLDKAAPRKRKKAAMAAAAVPAAAEAAATASEASASASDAPLKAPRRAYELNARRPKTPSASSRSSSFSSFSTASNDSAGSNLSLCSFRAPRACAQRGDTVAIAVVVSPLCEDR